MRLLRYRWAAFAVILFVIECLIATVWRRVPFVRADLGDFLVVILLYAMAKALRPFRATPLALGIFAFSVCVECAQGIGLADRLGFARGSIPSIIIGTTFQWSDILMYGTGCLAAWVIDRPGRQLSRT
jgi:hypothetical protein